MSHQSQAFPYPYSVRVSLRAKRINLRILPNKTIVLTIPHRISHATAIEWLHQKREWIAKYMDKNRGENRGENRAENIDLCQPPILDLTPPTRIALPVFDMPWHVLYETTLGQRAQLIERPDHCLVYCGPQDDEQKLKKLRHWLHHKAASFLAQRITALSQEYQLAFTALSFRTQRTLWGSCNRAKKISLNYKLIFLPPTLIDYVLIHELAHLRHLNHSSTFWNFLAQFYPDHQQARQQLRVVERDIPAWFYTSTEIRPLVT